MARWFNFLLREQVTSPLCDLAAPRYPHLKKQGRCVVHKREAPEGEEDSFEWTEEEQEEGPEQLAALEGDEEVGGGAAWSPLFSSSNEHVKNQVGQMETIVLGSTFVWWGGNAVI